MSEKMREEFEAWARRHNESLREDEPDQPEDIRLDRQAGVYIWANAESAWLAWKASRESLVVEIPYPGHWTLDRDMVIDAIHAAGVRTK